MIHLSGKDMMSGCLLVHGSCSLNFFKIKCLMVDNPCLRFDLKNKNKTGTYATSPVLIPGKYNQYFKTNTSLLCK